MVAVVAGMETPKRRREEARRRFGGKDSDAAGGGRDRRARRVFGGGHCMSVQCADYGVRSSPRSMTRESCRTGYLRRNRRASVDSGRARAGDRAADPGHGPRGPVVRRVRPGPDRLPPGRTHRPRRRPGRHRADPDRARRGALAARRAGRPGLRGHRVAGVRGGAAADPLDRGHRHAARRPRAADAPAVVRGGLSVGDRAARDRDVRGARGRPPPARGRRAPPAPAARGRR